MQEEINREGNFASDPSELNPNDPTDARLIRMRDEFNAKPEQERQKIEKSLGLGHVSPQDLEASNRFAPILEPQRKADEETQLGIMESVFGHERDSAEFQDSASTFAEWFDASSKEIPNFDRLVEYGEKVLGVETVMRLAHELSRQWKRNR